MSFAIVFGQFSYIYNLRETGCYMMERKYDLVTQVAQQPILHMKISDTYVSSRHLVGSGVVKISLIDLGPFGGLMFARV
jgi:hypothetical protein